MAKTTCAGCRKPLPFNGGALIEGREYCARCGARAREAIRQSARAREEEGQQVLFGDELPRPVTGQGRLL